MREINIFKLCIILLMIFLFMTGCGSEESDPAVENSGGSPDETVIEEMTEKYNYISELAKQYDFEGYEFKIMVPATEDHMPDSGPALYSSESLNGEIVNDILYTRNQYIEDNLNIKINVFAHSPGGLGDTYKSAANSILANDYAFDLLIPHTLFGPEQLAVEGYLAEWGNVNTVDFTDEWWDSDAIETFTVAGRELFAVSEFNFGNLGNTYGMFFNKKFIESHGLDNPYTLVKNKKWTIDKVLKMTSELYVDLNGDDKVDKEDQFGYSGSNTGVLLGFMYAANIKYMNTDTNGVPYYDFVNEKTNLLIDKMLGLYYNDNRSYIYGNNEIDIFTAMQEERLFLQADKIGEIIKLRDYDVEFGIIPYPLYDENQEKYLTYVDAWGGVLCLPINADDESLQRTGVILDALSYETMTSVKPKYYEIALKTKYARDDESSEMLDILYDGILFDLGYIFCSKLENIWMFCDNINSKTNNFTSKMASIEEKIDTYLSNVYDSITNLD